MATPEPYETKDGIRYRIRYRTPENKQTSKRGFRTKKEAQLFAAKITMDMARGEFVNPAAGRATVGELAPAWLKMKRRLKPGSYAPLETAWRTYVEPRWGSTPIGKVQSSAVEGWITDLVMGDAPSAHKYEAEKGKPRSATTALRALGVLAGILDMAVKDHRIARNPARNTENLPTKSSTKTNRYLTHGEVQTMAASAPDRNTSTLVQTLAYSGIRWGEAGALRVRDLDFERKRIRVARSASWVKRVMHVGPVKNWEKRSVPIPASLLPLLEKECEEKGADDLVFPDAKTGSHLGMPDLRNDRNGWWIVMLRESGIERLTPHDLRHTYASLSVAAGANVKALQKALGHKSAAMTLDIYADLFDSDLDQVAVALDNAWQASVVSKM